MADHRRKVIRAAIVAKLTGLTTTGSRVYASRVMPMDDVGLPGLIVYAGAEEIDVDTDSRVSRVQERALYIIVEAYDKISTGLDDKLDLILSEIETALLAPGAISSASNIDLVEIDEPEIDAGLEKPVGKMRMTFRVQYLTADGDPTTAI